MAPVPPQYSESSADREGSAWLTKGQCSVQQPFAMDLKAWFANDAERIQHNLGRYFAGAEGDSFTGRWFERWRANTDPGRIRGG